MYFKKRAQTATEYLIIISLTIIITLIVISIMGGIPGIGGSGGDKVSRLALASQEIAILSYGVSDYDTVFTLKNTHNVIVQIDSITINGTECSFFYGQKPLLGSDSSQQVFCEDVIELDESTVSWSIIINWTDTYTGASYSQKGDDLVLVDAVGSKYMKTLEANEYWNNVDGCWDTSGSEPYPICTCLDLARIDDNATTRGYDYTLQNSIDMQRCDDTFGTSYMEGSGWTPIGTFTGLFEGDNNIINNLFIDTASSEQGLFGTFNNDPIIQNVGLTNVDITSTSGNIGGIVGTLVYGTISNSYVSGSVSGIGNIGGLVGTSYYSGAIVNSYSSGSVTGTAPNVGGLVGNRGLIGPPYYLEVSNSYSSSDVSGTSRVGGLIGYGYYAIISNSYTTGITTCTGTYCGGLVGLDFGSTYSGTNTWVNHSGSNRPGECIGTNAAAPAGSSIPNCTP